MTNGVGAASLLLPEQCQRLQLCSLHTRTKAPELPDRQLCRVRINARVKAGVVWRRKNVQFNRAQVATLRSAVRMEQENQFLIAKKLQELTGSKNIKLKPVIDESLIAGFVIEFGSSQIDLSVKGRLEKVEAELYKQQALAS